MSGKPSEYTAKAGKETGTVWSAVFAPCPSEEFLSDFGWEAYDDQNRRLEFEAYAVRKLVDAEGRGRLQIRFRDRFWTPLGEGANVTVRIVHPSP